MMQTQRPRKRRSWGYGGGRRGWSAVKYGMIAFAIGVVITIATYVFAVSRGGGTYVVSYGPMIIGLISMARGGIDMARERRASGPATGGTQAVGQWGSGGPGFGGQPGWQGGNTRAAFQSADAAQPGGTAMSAQAMPGAGDHAGMRFQAGAGTPAPMPNWYPDPQNPAMLRWWDGQGWTGHTRPSN